MKKKYYWKVVRYDGKYYYSVTTNKEWALNYKIGKKTKPRIGKIFVFDTRENARTFVKNRLIPRYKIFKAEIIGNVYPAKLQCDWWIKASVELFWLWQNSGISTPPSHIYTSDVYKGTCFADSVKLVEAA